MTTYNIYYIIFANDLITLKCVTNMATDKFYSITLQLPATTVQTNFPKGAGMPFLNLSE